MSAGFLFMPFDRVISCLRPALLLGAAFAAGGVQAQPVAVGGGQAVGHEFVLAGEDGYGVADCMRPGMECGRVMADAWCEAHGQGHAASFGLAADVTGSTTISTTSSADSPLPENSVVIRCGD